MRCLRRLRLTALATLLAAGLQVACPGEPCGTDPANQNNQAHAICGNGVPEAAEACDDGAENSDTAPDGCRTDCTLPRCGDGVRDTGEDCDRGPGNSDTDPGACRTSCRLPGCGDGVVDADESCDDGGAGPGDGCSASCGIEPGWRCSGSPSRCQCRVFHHGDRCDCVVLVDADPAITVRDGKTWATALGTLQKGIDQAASLGEPCEVWVASGTYRNGSGLAPVTLTLRDRVTVYGGFAGGETDRSQRDPDANVTVIDGAGQAEPAVTVSLVSDVGLDGLVVRNTVSPTGGLLVSLSNLTVEGCVIENHQGGQGGGLLAYHSTLRLNRSRVQSNTATGDGGGIWMTGSDVELVDCELSENTAVGTGGALALIDSGTLVVRRSVLRSNLARDGGAFGYAMGWASSSPEVSPSVTFSDCRLERNRAEFSGGALGLWATYVELTLERSELLLNEVASAGTPSWGGGALFCQGCHLTLRDSLLADNTVDSLGPAVCLEGCTSFSQIVGCTLTRNEAPSGAAVHLLECSPRIVNSILWDNSPASLLDGTATVSYSSLSGVTCSAGCIDGDPRFVDPDGGDYRLRATSPCIDAGSGNEASATDLDGSARADVPGVDNGGVGNPPYVDLGAYEYVP